VFSGNGRDVDEKERDGGMEVGTIWGGYERVWEIRGTTCRIGFRTCRIGFGKLTFAHEIL